MAEDELNHYLTMVGSCYEDARLGRLNMRVDLSDGSWIEDVPSLSGNSTTARGTVDDTGIAAILRLGRTSFRLDQVVSYCVRRPDLA